MADDSSDNNTPPPPSGKRRGRPKRGIGQPKATRDVIYSRSLRERLREKVDPDDLILFHQAILQGINPVFVLSPETGNWYVTADPSTMAPTPTLQQKIESVRWLAERRDGLPAQSIQIDAEVRQKMEMLGTGVPTELLALNNPRTLDLLKMALAEAMGNIEDAELELDNDDTAPVNAETNTNSPPSSEDSEL